MKTNSHSIEQEIQRLRAKKTALAKKQAQLKAQLAAKRDEEDRALMFAVGRLIVATRHQSGSRQALMQALPNLSSDHQAMLKRLLGLPEKTSDDTTS